MQRVCGDQSDRPKRISQISTPRSADWTNYSTRIRMIHPLVAGYQASEGAVISKERTGRARNDMPWFAYFALSSSEFRLVGTDAVQREFCELIECLRKD